MDIKECISMALFSIKSNKMRTFLTMLGIIIGISSVIMMVAIGDGSKKAMKDEFQSLGTNKLTIYSSSDDDSSDGTEIKMITHNDLNTIARIYGDKLEALSPNQSLQGNITRGRKEYKVNINGVAPGYNKIANFKSIHGRFFGTDESSSGRSVAVIDEKMAQKLYPNEDALGKVVTIKADDQSMSFLIVGVFKLQTSKFSFGENNTFTLYTPYTYVENITGSTEYYVIEGTGKDGSDIKGLSNDIVRLLNRKYQAPKGKSYFQSFTPQSEMKMINDVLSKMTLFISAIAAISLLVGGIGIMNIMLVSVTERTREIGVRKAIGANKRDILFQFIIESVIVSGIGGIIGILLGYLLSNIALLFKITPVVNIQVAFIAFAFSAAIGIFFGIYPAKKAANLNTIDALRYE